MKQSIKHFSLYLFAFAAIIIACVGIFVTNYENSMQVAQAEIQSAGCTASSSRIFIGNQASTLVVASSSNRATLHVEQPDVATNTVYFRLAQGAPATIANGTIILEETSATATRSRFEIGKNTPLPYTGAVTAISDTGSTTILVTECIY